VGNTEAVDYGKALTEQNGVLTQTLTGVDLSVPVPTCPGWSLLQLLRHVGRGDRWAAQIIRDRTGPDLDPRVVQDGRPPDDEAQALAWLRSSPMTLIDAVEGAGPQTAVATFLGPRPAAWWLRRRLHEATVHRADAAIALGLPYELAADLAADGIDEWLELLVVQQRQGKAASLGPGLTLALRATDRDLDSAQWLVRGTPSGIVRIQSDDSPTTAVVGRAVDLFLALVRRRSITEVGVQVEGDPEPWRQWLDQTSF
jgi:uncharacterized protein (TIGR03083 family)